MKKLIAYNNDPELKAGILAEVHKHYLADQIVKGHYGKMNGKWTGCAVGCSIRSYNLLTGKNINENDHKAFELFGIPMLLAKLNDRIFEGLPDTHNKEWPERFLSAINPGTDLHNIWPKFAYWLMVDPDHGVLRFAKTDRTRNAINLVASLYEDGEWPSRKDAADAYASAAYASAADAYASAYASAAAAAAAADAADSADSADSAAYAAADAAAAYASDDSAAYASDDSAAYASAAYASAAYASAAYASAAYASAADASASAAAADAYAAYAARYNEYVAQADELIELLKSA